MSKSSTHADLEAFDRRRGDPAITDDRAAEAVDPADRAAVEAGLADLRAGRLATSSEVEAAYARFGRTSR